MSTTGARHVGQPTPEGRAVLLAPSPLRREEVIEQGVAGARITHGPVHFDETLVRERLAAAFDRAFNPLGTSRQFLAVLTDGDRTQRLATITAPTLVIHGAADPLITPSGGEHTAAVIPGASLLMIEAMGHDIPQPLWPRVVEAVAGHIRSAEAAQSR
jgi:pimeloyl-ACP methyl ester carboxylesterase